MAKNTFENAIRESIRQYFENESFDNLLPSYKKASTKKIKYDKKFFDEFSTSASGDSEESLM
jgi:hypothetical protein